MLSIQTFLARRLTKVRLRVKIYLHTHEAFLRERNKAVDRPSGLEKVYANFPGTETMNASLAIQHLLHNLPSAAIETFLALFPIVNPLGGIPLFFSLTADYTPEERRHTALTTALYVVAILVIFMLFGRFVLHFFGISLPVLKIAGGLIVANTAWGMVTGSIA